MSAENKPITDPQSRSLEEDVPELIIEEIDSRGVALSVSQFSGPVPHPALMKEYAEIDPDFPKRLFEIAERQQIHDHAVEKDIIATNKAIALNHQTLERWGQIYSRKNVSSPQPLSPTPQSPPPSQEGE